MSVKCGLANMAVKNSTPLERWKSRVSVMLEKRKGVINVSKLRAILLLEVDFNGLNKLIYNTRVLLILENSQSIPYEIIGGRRG